MMFYHWRKRGLTAARNSERANALIGAAPLAAEENEMDIRTKNTDRAFYQVEPTLATILLELGMVVQINQTITPPEPPTHKWGVTVDRGGNTCIVMTFGATTSWFDGHPDDAAHGFQRRDWKGTLTGPETPEHICKLYESQMLPSDWMRIRMIKR